MSYQHLKPTGIRAARSIREVGLKWRPAWEGLTHLAVDCGEKDIPTNILTGERSTVHGSPVRGATARGIGTFLDSTSIDGFRFADGSDFMTAPFTVLVYADVDITVKNFSGLFGSWHASASASGWVLTAEAWNNTGKVGWTAYGVADNVTGINTPTVPTAYLVAVDSATSVRIYVGDQEEALSPTAWNTATADGIIFGTGHRNDAEVFADPMDGTILVAATWAGRALDAGTCRAIAADPFGLVTRPLRLGWIPTLEPVVEETSAATYNPAIHGHRKFASPKKRRKYRVPRRLLKAAGIKE